MATIFRGRKATRLADSSDRCERFGMMVSSEPRPGTVEEITYRGVMFALLLAMTRNWWTAVAICVVFFALGHANQGLLRMSFVGAIAVGCHVLVWMTGALYLSMAVHFAYDFIAGIVYLRWAQQTKPAA